MKCCYVNNKGKKIDLMSYPYRLLTGEFFDYEWTETSYLMPCNVFGYGYLEAVKKVFIDIQ